MNQILRFTLFSVDRLQLLDLNAARFKTVKRWIHSAHCRGRYKSRYKSFRPDATFEIKQRDLAIATDNHQRKIHGSTARHNDAAAFLMSNDQPDDDTANGTGQKSDSISRRRFHELPFLACGASRPYLVSDLPTDKNSLLGNLSSKRSYVQAVTSGYKAATIEQRTWDGESTKRILESFDSKGSDDGWFC